MKLLPSVALLGLLSVSAMADIQDPPMNDQGPTRKLGRGLANIAFGATEITHSASMLLEREGSASAFSYGPVKGFGRFFARFGYGVYEVVTFPFPTSRDSYQAPYRSNIPWINGGFEEFPPELGFQSRYRYVRSYGSFE